MEFAAVRLSFANVTMVYDPISGDLPLRKTFKSRGHYPNYGSGAYFCARKTPKVRGNGVVVEPGKMIDITRGSEKYTYVSYGNYGGYAIDNYAGTLSVNIYTVYFDHMSGRTAYQQVSEVHYSWPKGKWPYPDLHSALRALCKRLPKSGRVSQATMIALQTLDDEIEYRLNEHEAFCSIEDIGVYPHGYAQGFSRAYVEALQGFAEAATNTIANVLETASMAAGAIETLRDPIKGFKKIAKDYKDPRNAWLAYRYSYTTTKLDIEEYKALTEQLMVLARYNGDTFHLDGNFTDEKGIRYHCRVVVSTDALLPHDTNDWLRKIGFKLSLANAWDMVPYSFVVDWFLHISDILDYFERWGRSMTLSPTEIWYSCNTSYDGQTVYFRVPGRRLDVPPAVQEIHVSGRTFKMRCADAISLFT